MKCIGIYLLLLLCTSGAVTAQDTLFFDDFEGNPAFSLNTSDLGANTNGFNDWIINNSYSGGSGSLICQGFPFSFNVATTTAQPAGISSPNGNYLHTLGDDAAANNIFCSNYRPADGFCTFAETNFSGMTADVSTLGYDTVTYSFWWLCGGSTTAFGEVYYSTNSGTSWTVVSAPVAQYVNQTTWTQSSLQEAAFANQATLRFGFLFNNQQATAGADPGFSIDDALITGIGGCAATVDSQMVAICPGDSVFAGGSFQTTGGTYVDTLMNSQGCDSLRVTDLSLLPSYLVFDSASICQGDNIFLGGALQTMPGIYTDVYSTALNCDSIVQTLLTVNPVYSVSDTVSICQGDSAFLGGGWQTVAAAYFDGFQTVSGCDSNVFTILMVDPAYSINRQDTICAGDSVFIGGAFQTQSGLYIDNFPTSSGCDSTIQTQLTMIQVDTSVSEVSNMLVSNAQNASFSWYDCITGNPVGNTTATFTPTTTGQYAVMVTQDGCISSSGCHTVVVVSTEAGLLDGIQVYPVPTQDIAIVSFRGKVLSGACRLLNLQGKLLVKQSFEGATEINLQTSQLPAGVYLLEINSGGASRVIKILKN